ncbi:hypothetical protein Aduo_005213 [Ancylostoma duodenale]
MAHFCARLAPVECTVVPARNTEAGPKLFHLRHIQVDQHFADSFPSFSSTMSPRLSHVNYEPAFQHYVCGVENPSLGVPRTRSDGVVTNKQPVAKRVRPGAIQTDGPTTSPEMSPIQPPAVPPLPVPKRSNAIRGLRAMRAKLPSLPAPLRCWNGGSTDGADEDAVERQLGPHLESSIREVDNAIEEQEEVPARENVMEEIEERRISLNRKLTYLGAFVMHFGVSKSMQGYIDDLADVLCGERQQVTVCQNRRLNITFVKLTVAIM